MSVKEQRQPLERLSARVDPEVAVIAKHVAETERRPVSSVLRNALQDWAKRYRAQHQAAQKSEAHEAAA